MIENKQDKEDVEAYKDWLLWLRSFPIDMQFDNIRLINIVLLIRNNIFV